MMKYISSYPTLIKIMVLSAVMCFVTHGSNAQEDVAVVSKPTEMRFGPEAVGYVLGVRSDKSTYKTRDNIYLYMSLKNVLKEEVLVESTNKLAKFRVEIVAPNNKLAPLTLYGEEMKKVNPYAKTIVRYLAPDEKLDHTFHLNRVFDMSLAGKYTIRVSSPNRNPQDHLKTVDVKSVDINLEIQDAP